MSDFRIESGGSGGGGTPGGSNTQVQFNDVGSFGGDSLFTYDKTNDVLKVHKIAGDASDGLLIEASNGTDIGILGAANTANVTWYGSHNFDTATANSVAYFGASKTLSSDSGMTYDSTNDRLTLSHAGGGPMILATNPSGGGSSLSLGAGSSLSYLLYPSGKVFGFGPVADITAAPSSSDFKVAMDSTSLYVGAYATLNSEKLIAWGNVALGDNGTNTASQLRFYEPSGSGSNYTAIKAQAQSGNVTYTLPSSDGSSGTYLSTNGSGGLSWVTPSASISIGGTISSGTAGSVLFIDPANTLAQDNSNFYYSNADNALGVQTTTPGAAIYGVSSTTQTISAVTGEAILAQTFTPLEDVVAATATQANGRVEQPTSLIATIDTTGTGFTEADREIVYRVYSSKVIGSTYYSRLYTEATITQRWLDTPTTFSATINYSGSGYTADGKTIDYQLYGYQTINSQKYYTPVAATQQTIDDSSTNPYQVDLSWDNMQVDGYVLLKQINGGGFNNGIDLGNVQSYSDQAFGDTATTVTPNTIAFEVDLSWTASVSSGLYEYKILKQIDGAGFNDSDVVSVPTTTYTDTGFAGGITTITPTIDDYVANNTTAQYQAYAYATSPSGTTYYSENYYAYSFGDSNDNRDLTVDHVITAVTGAVGYRVIGANDRTSLNASYNDADGTFNDVKGIWVGSTTVTPSKANMILSNGNNLNRDYRIYAYKTIGANTFYSSTYEEVNVTDPNDSQYYKVTVSWSAVSGATGYKILRQIDYIGYNEAITTTGTSVVDDNLTSWNASLTVTPTSFTPSAVGAEKSNTSFTDPPQMLAKTSGTHTAIELRSSSDATIGSFGADSTYSYLSRTYASTIPALKFNDSLVYAAAGGQPFYVRSQSGNATMFYSDGDDNVVIGEGTTPSSNAAVTVRSRFTNQPILSIQPPGASHSANYFEIRDSSGNQLHVCDSTKRWQFNYGLADIDFNIAGDTKGNLFFVDASTDRIGINTPSPTTMFTVEGLASVKAGAASDLAYVGGVMNVSWSDVGNTGTGEDDLITYSIPASTLGTAGDSIEFTAAGTIANNINAKRIRAYFGSQAIFDTGAAGIPVSAAIDWEMKGTIIRTGAATQECSVSFTTDNLTFPASAAYTDTTQTLSSAITLKLTGEATSNNDIVQEFLKVKWEPNNS